MSQIVYPVIHNGERSERKQADKSQYKVRTGYVGQRYKNITDENKKYFTTRSIYTRHKEISHKYHYDFSPKQSKTLIFLKRKWNEQLFAYLSQFGKGFYLKKRSAKDKRQFKLQNGFQIKKNPLFRMLDLLDKLNYSFVVMKLFYGFKKMSQCSNFSSQFESSGNSSEYLLREEPKLYQISQTKPDEGQIQSDQDYQNTQEQFHTPMYKAIKFPISDKKYMRAYDSYKDQHYNGRFMSNKFYKIQTKSIAWIKKTHRKHLKNDSISKIINYMKVQYSPESY